MVLVRLAEGGQQEFLAFQPVVVGMTVAAAVVVLAAVDACKTSAVHTEAEMQAGQMS